MSARLSVSQSFAWALMASAFMTVACDDSLKSVSLIEETRVLGARVEVEADPARGSPLPGERASLRLFVAAPGAAPNLSYALSVCAVSPVNAGSPSCASAPFASTLQAEPTSTVPQLDFEVPADLDLAATPHGFASALICPDSAASLAANGAPSCAEGPGTEVAFEFEFATPERANQNPSFSADALTLDGAAWPAADAAATCPDGLPEVAAKSSHRFGVSLNATDFEALVQASSVEPARETLLVSQFSSAGKLNHAFLSVSWDTPEADRRVTWEAPAGAGSVPSLVRFYFVVRDARGGEDFTTRALCVAP